MNEASAIDRAFASEPPSRWPEARRVCCACGCGLWFYVVRAAHRPRAYARPECYQRERNRRRRVARSHRGER